MKILISTLTLLLIASTPVFAVPDPRDSIILESKTIMPGAAAGATADTGTYLRVRVFITNKDTLSNVTLPVVIRSLSGGTFITGGWPRNFGGNASLLSSHLRSTIVFVPRMNSITPDSATWAGFYDQGDNTTWEPPNSARKPLWDLKFDTVQAPLGTVEIDSIKILSNSASFVDVRSPIPNLIKVNFVKSVITVTVPGGGCGFSCAGAGQSVLYGRNYQYDFQCEMTGSWSVSSGPGTIDSATGLYSLGGHCPLGPAPVSVRFTHPTGGYEECSFTLNVLDNAPTCSAVQETIMVSHGTPVSNQFSFFDPDPGDLFVPSVISGPGTISPNGEWLHVTDCSDAGTGPQVVRIQLSDGFGDCLPGPGADTCEFQLIVINASPGFTNCPLDVVRVDSNATFSFQFQAADADPVDAGNLVFGLDSGPAGLSISPAGLLEWTPSPAQFGLHTAGVQVTDLCGSSSLCPITFSVSVQRGDLNVDRFLTAADIMLLLNCAFLGIVPPVGLSACDLDCDGFSTSPDVVLLLNAVFLGNLFPC